MTITSLAQAKAQGVAATASGTEALYYVETLSDPSIDQDAVKVAHVLFNKGLLKLARAMSLPDDYFGYLANFPGGTPKT